MKIFIFGLIFVCYVAAKEFYINIPSDEENIGMEKATEKSRTVEINGENLQNFTTPKPPPEPQNISIKIYKTIETHYYGEVLVGHPGQKFRMLLDVSSRTSWVPSYQCSPFVNPSCALRNRYRSFKSTTFQSLRANETIFTERGKYFGFLAKEKFHVEHVSVHNLTFLEIETMPFLESIHTEYDGVLGLAIDTDPKSRWPTFISSIFNQYRSINPVFSFYFNRDETTTKGGTLFIGGSEKKHYNGSFTYIPVKNLYYWSFKMDKISINYVLPYRNTTAEVCSSGCEAYPSTGDVLIQGPKNDIRTINRLISANYVAFLDRYEVNCNSINLLPTITFYLGGKPFPLDGRHYIQKLSYGPLSLCLSAFAEMKNISDMHIWGLGISFFGRYYSKFDLTNKKIGIVRAL